MGTSYSELILVYLLIGFVLHFIGSMLSVKRGSVLLELTAVLLWPLVVTTAIVFRATEKEKAVDR